MSMTGMWCFQCGYKYGLVPMPVLPKGIEVIVHGCDGCGDQKLAIPAYHFKISVATARRAIEKRSYSGETSSKEKDHDECTNDGS